MGTVHKNITLTDQKDRSIGAPVDAGVYSNDSEYIGDLIQRGQGHNGEIDVIRTALIEGEESGEPMPFDVAAFKQKMLATIG